MRYLRNFQGAVLITRRLVIMMNIYSIYIHNIYSMCKITKQKLPTSVIVVEGF